MYIYIYIDREREMCIYIYIEREREREREILSLVSVLVVQLCVLVVCYILYRVTCIIIVFALGVSFFIICIIISSSIITIRWRSCRVSP